MREHHEYHGPEPEGAWVQKYWSASSPLAATPTAFIVVVVVPSRRSFSPHFTTLRRPFPPFLAHAGGRRTNASAAARERREERRWLDLTRGRARENSPSIFLAGQQHRREPFSDARKGLGLLFLLASFVLLIIRLSDRRYSITSDGFREKTIKTWLRVHESSRFLSSNRIELPMRMASIWFKAETRERCVREITLYLSLFNQIYIFASIPCKLYEVIFQKI